MIETVKKWVEPLMADRKKMFFMVALLGLAMLLWGRLILQQVPRVATADDPMAEVVDSSPAILPDEVKKPIGPVVEIHLAGALQRDLFDFNTSPYKRIESPDKSSEEEKSVVEAADEMSVSQLVRTEARALRLQSVMSGDRPRAVINNRLLAEGDEINGFVLQEVAERHVLLEKNGIVIRLKM